MNKRFVLVGIVLGVVITFALIIGSPAIGGFDSLRYKTVFLNLIIF